MSPIIAAAQSSVPPQVVVCLAGHIDHGKSSLVRALTDGIVDRLPEERRRGMTIELGFSHFDAAGFRFALIDVPGHERFIHTMVAGASGVDLAILVVAADDSVMPQTREHLALLELLGVRRAVIAISKSDLVDSEHLEFVRLEVAELIESTPLAGSPMIAVSTQNGSGIRELRSALIEAAGQTPDRAKGGTRFRMPIDRAFSVPGQGAVVTGTIWHGTARVGATLELLPATLPVRIRRLQSQGMDVESVCAGQRAAINLAGVKASEIQRGDELTTPQAFEPARRHLVRLQCLPSAGQLLKHRDRVRLHLGASQGAAQIFLAQKEISPGETAYAVVQCGAPVVASHGQPFVVRSLSPARTLGGGTVVGPALRPVDRLKRSLKTASGLADQASDVRLAAWIEIRREVATDDLLEFRLGLDRSEYASAERRLIEQRRIVRTSGPRPRLVTKEHFEQLKQQMVERCRAEIERRKPAWQIPLSVVLSAMSRHASSPVLEAVLEELVSEGQLVRRDDRIGPHAGAELSHRQRALFDQLLASCSESVRTPPTLTEFAGDRKITLRDLEPLVRIAVDTGRLHRVAPELVMAPAALDELRRDLSSHFQHHPAAKVSEIREKWGLTRKYAVPILEYFDKLQVTTRNGDLRLPGPNLATSFKEEAS